MTSSVQLDVKLFHQRLSKIYEYWQSSASPQLRDADCVFVIFGKSSNVLYNKTKSVHNWLFGYDITDTLLVLGRGRDVGFFATPRKVEFVSAAGSQPDSAFRLLTTVYEPKSPLDAAIAGFFESFRAQTGSDFRRFATFIGEFEKSDIYVHFHKILADSNIQVVDIKMDFANMFMPKDEQELGYLDVSGRIVVNIFNKFIKKKLIQIMESNRPISNNKFSQVILDVSDQQPYIDKDIESEDVEASFTPVVSSGYSATNSTVVNFYSSSNENKLSFDIIVFMLGIRYKYYSTAVARTFIVSPDETVKKNYTFLLSLFDELLAFFQNSFNVCSTLGQAHRAVIDYARNSDCAHLINFLPASFGFLTGIEFEEESAQISENNSTVIKPNTVYIITLSLNNVPLPNGKYYNLIVSDTVCLKDGAVEVLTNPIKKQLSNVTITMNESDDEKEREKYQKEEEFARPHTNSDSKIVTRIKKLSEQKKVNVSKFSSVEERERHQKQLFKSMNETAKARISNLFENNGELVFDKKQADPNSKHSPVNLNCYKNNIENFSAVSKVDDVKKDKIHYDKANDCLILPIYQQLVPVHISMIKAVGTTVENDYIFLRISFNACWNLSAFNVNSNKINVNLTHIIFEAENVVQNSIVPDSVHLLNICRVVKECQKKYQVRIQNESQMENLITQESLVVNQQLRNECVLKEIYVRPHVVFAGAKTTAGKLEAHVNGIRYQHYKGNRIEILYKNIKYAFFQPCVNDVIIIIHVVLRNPILIGKKQHSQIQFYADTGLATSDLDRRTDLHNVTEQEEYEAEQADMMLRKKLNKRIGEFCKLVAAASNGSVQFELPERHFGFEGVSNRMSTFMYPTKTCLVSLSESPFFVLPLDSIEFVHLERVQFSIKNFDMIFVLKDYTKKPVMVSTVPVVYMDVIKEWLSSNNIACSEGVQSLNWGKIMKTIVEDVDGFFASGGWSFVSMESDEEEEEENDEEEEEEENDEEVEDENSEKKAARPIIDKSRKSSKQVKKKHSSDEEEDYDPGEEDDDSSGEESFSSDEDKSEKEEDSSSNMSDELKELQGSTNSSELSDEGLSWDELEKIAKQEDARKHGLEDEERRKGAPMKKTYNVSAKRKSSNSQSHSHQIKRARY